MGTVHGISCTGGEKNYGFRNFDTVKSLARAKHSHDSYGTSFAVCAPSHTIAKPTSTLDAT